MAGEADAVTPTAVDQVAADQVAEVVEAPAEAASATDQAIATDANSAGSSDAGADAKGTPEKKSLLDVVKSAAEQKTDAKAAEGSSPTDGSQDKTADAAGADKAKAEGVDKSDAEIPAEFHKHPAWQRLIRERDENKGAAEQFGQITGFMDKHGLSPAEAAEGFTVMAMIKVDPAGALKALEAKADEIRQFLGEKLPDDLQKEVEDGTISEGRAKELAQARNHRAALANQVKAGTQAREADAAQAVSIANRTAVIEWEKQVKARDPDYAIKHPMILDRIRAVVLSPGGKRPASPDEAVALAKRAYDDVTAYLTKIRPAKLEVRPTPSGASVTPAAKPKSLREAIALGARGG